jgi:hypothetical protein
VHSPTGIAINIALLSPGAVKSWLATGATVFASSGGLGPAYGKNSRVTAPDGTAGCTSVRPDRVPAGRPVAIHRLYALGFQQHSTRVLIHSVFGCLFFGAFTVKMLILPKRGLHRLGAVGRGCGRIHAAGRHLAHVRHRFFHLGIKR